MNPATSTPANGTPLGILRTVIQVFATRRYEDVDIHEFRDLPGFDRDLSRYGGKEGIYASALWVACREVGQLARLLPEPPGVCDPEAPLKAAEALRAHIRLLLPLGLGMVPDVVPEQARDQARDNVRMVIREMSSPHVGSKSYLLEAVGPYTDHLAQCVRALRPDLDGEAVFRMGLSVHGQILFLDCHSALVPLIRDQPYLDGELESLAEHCFNFCLKGISE